MYNSRYNTKILHTVGFGEALQYVTDYLAENKVFVMPPMPKETDDCIKNENSGGSCGCIKLPNNLRLK